MFLHSDRKTSSIKLDQALQPKTVHCSLGNATTDIKKTNGGLLPGNESTHRWKARVCKNMPACSKRTKQ